MPPKMKANPRKQELSDALGRARATSATIPAILRPAAEAMTSKAWVGGASGDFEGGLSEHVAGAQKGGTASVDEVQHAYDTCPAEIPDPTAQGDH